MIATQPVLPIDKTAIDRAAWEVVRLERKQHDAKWAMEEARSAYSSAVEEVTQVADELASARTALDAAIRDAAGIDPEKEVDPAEIPY